MALDQTSLLQSAETLNEDGVRFIATQHLPDDDHLDFSDICDWNSGSFDVEAGLWSDPSGLACMSSIEYDSGSLDNRNATTPAESASQQKHTVCHELSCLADQASIRLQDGTDSAAPLGASSLARGKQRSSVRRNPARNKISVQAKRKLEDHFASNPYPTFKEKEELARSNGLLYKTVRTWFANARSRNDTVKCKLIPECAHRHWDMCYDTHVL